MKLYPKKTKFRKAFKGKIRTLSKRGMNLTFGEYGLKALSSYRIQEKHIEAARKVITRYLKRQGKLWIRIYPNIPVTKKPIDVRMGKGKGAVEHYVTKVCVGRIIFEVTGVTEEQAYEAFDKAKSKLPIKTTFVKNYI